MKLQKLSLLEKKVEKYSNDPIPPRYAEYDIVYTKFICSSKYTKDR